MKRRRTGSDKDIPLKELLPFVFLIGTSTALGEKEAPKLTIKKCCPKGQELNSTLMCVNATGDLKNDKVKNTGDAGEKAPPFAADDPPEIFPQDFHDGSSENDSSFPRVSSWFPFPSLLSAETLQQITNLSAVMALLGDADLRYGAQPKCPPDEKDWSCFKAGRSQQFYLLFYPHPRLKLYISKKSSYHEQKRFRVDDRSCDFLENGSDGETKEKGEEEWDGDPAWDVRELRTFPVEDFCVDRGPGGSYLVEYCPCKTVPCVRKCCPDSELFDKENKKCVSNSTFGFWRPSLKKSNLTRNYYLLSNRHPSTCANPSWLKMPPNAIKDVIRTCGYRESREDRNKFLFLPDGSLKVTRQKTSIPAQSYCGDHMIYDSNDLVKNNLLFCGEDKASVGKLRVYGVLFIIGGIVLLLTNAISLYLPELRTSVYNKVIICHNMSLMVADFIWGSTYLLPHVPHKICIFLSLAIQCTFLESFFWMNIMCLDISLGIRRFKSSNETSDNQRFLWYSIYACGAPIIITSVTAAMEFAPSMPQYVKPGFACNKCGFNPESLSILIYIYAPMMAVIFLNLIFFIRTVLQIIRIQRETAILGNQTSTPKNLRKGKKRLVIFGKLFLLMGLSWIMEIISWLVGGQEYYWYIPDFVNILRAVFIFLIIICNKKILRSLTNKLKGLREESYGSYKKSTGLSSQPEGMRERGTTTEQQTKEARRQLDESDM